MGQKVNPIGFRLQVNRDWRSRWYASRKDYADFLLADQRIREHLKEKLRQAAVSKIVIERTLKRVTITIHTARPGVIIGKGGAEVDKLREELKKLTGKEIQLNIFEIKRPELDARLVAFIRHVQGRLAAAAGGCSGCAG